MAQNNFYSPNIIGTDSRPRIKIVSYKGLSRLVRTVVSEYESRANIEISDTVFEATISKAQELERYHKTNVVISAGANAAMLRSRLSSPVVVIKPSGYDVLLALIKARSYAERVGIVTFKEPIPEIDKIKEILRIQISQLTYTTIEDVADCFHSLASDGFKVIIGSSLVVEMAEKASITGILYYTQSSVKQAIEDAIEIARIQHLEVQRYEQLNSVLRHLHEAVLAVNMKGQVIAINPLMEDLIGKPAEDILGHRLRDVMKELSLHQVLEERADKSSTHEVREVVYIKGQTYVADRIAIREQGNILGALLTLQNAEAIQKADSEIRTQRRTHHQLIARYHFDQIVGRSPAFQHAIQAAKRYAKTNTTVLITGESGTGKELFAQAMHNANQRCARPFVAINCAAFPESLLESELFGYEEGAFTGSRKGGKPGLFETAHTGTIFLDEIGDMPLSLQTRLLRTLQEKEIVRLGGIYPVPIDVRVIAATHRALETLVQRGDFRSDLYYRLNILRLHLPPLRERAKDIPELALRRLHASLQHIGCSLPSDQILAPLMPAIRSYGWPGNVRELDNIMERIAVTLSTYNYPSSIDYEAIKAELPELFSKPTAYFRPVPTTLPETILDDNAILDAIKRSGGNKQAAARLLGISRSTLWRRIQNIHNPDPPQENNPGF